MTINQLIAELQKQVKEGNGDTEIFIQHSNKTDVEIKHDDYQLPFRVNHYDDGAAIIV